MKLRPWMLAGLVAPLPIVAQVRVETNGGSSRLDQLRSTSLTDLTIAAAARVDQLSFQTSATAEDHLGLGYSGVAGVSARYRIDRGKWSLEVGPDARAGHDILSDWSAAVSGVATITRHAGPVQLHAGWGQGWLMLDNVRSPWYRPEIGAESKLGPFTMGASWQSTNTRAAAPPLPLFVAAAYASDSNAIQMRDIRDVALHLGWTGGPVSVTARAGRRFGASVTPQTWWESQAALRVASMAWLTVRTGELASDVLLNLRGGAYTTFGVRFEALSRTRHDGDDSAPMAEAIPTSESTLQLRLVLPVSTQQASINSDLTGWTALPLTRTDDGHWEVQLPRRMGAHRVSVSVNRGVWRAPDGLPAVDDGFGGRVGVLVVH